MNCRFCFRQNYPYSIEKELKNEIEVIEKDPSIYEVILSGGDPLSLSDQKLEKLIEKLDNIPHLKILRFHSRFPVGIPERITEDLVKILKNSRLQIFFIIHTNHPEELDHDLFNFLKKMNVPLLSQTVLLRGINDNIETLYNLFLKLSSNGIIPYYLHQLDKVKQASHFEVSIKKGKQLIKELRTLLPGYAVPNYVHEIPHKFHKSVLTED